MFKKLIIPMFLALVLTVVSNTLYSQDQSTSQNTSGSRYNAGDGTSATVPPVPTGVTPDNTWYDKEGYDKNGYDRNGYNRSGYDRYGYDRNGYNKRGYGKSGNKNNTGSRKKNIDSNNGINSDPAKTK